MLSAKDCLDFINLTEDELDQIERMMAIKKCSCLLDSPEGACCLHTIFMNNFNQHCECENQLEAVNARNGEMF